MSNYDILYYLGCGRFIYLIIQLAPLIVTKAVNTSDFMRLIIYAIMR